ncbi:hypothetical protein K8O68_17060 [Salipaludibacillus sp. CUR1]|uniref:hypothetical protein n=1 Tax=Salipaludibacillus sp. CUR1 TaxID=2820003 RepID=UPI001E385D82|nr:hypothetical protein [Salipaludibacillus sp. CUR1]MCE7794101.1 hypothetical protein [Salipaludibacillus sp. CUR1]
MKLIALFLMSLTAITFQSCSDAPSHEDVELTLDPVYAGGKLTATPMLVYEGDDDITFNYGSSLAWIDRIEHGDEVLYEYEETEADLTQQTTLENGGEREGEPVEIEVEPGTYDIHLSASFYLQGDESADNGGLEEYRHSKIQKVELRPDS